MPKQKLDSVTKKLVSEQKALQELVKHEGWNIVRRRMVDRIIELQNSFTDDLDTKTPEELAIELKVRKQTTTNLYQWIKQIEGDIEQFNVNAQLLQDIRSNFIMQLPEEEEE